jgi:hypothetical protein
VSKVDDELEFPKGNNIFVDTFTKEMKSQPAMFQINREVSAKQKMILLNRRQSLCPPEEIQVRE